MKQNSSIRGLHGARTTQPWEPLPCLLSHLTAKVKSACGCGAARAERRLLWPCTYVLCRSRKCWPWGWYVIPEANLKSSVIVWGRVWSGQSAAEQSQCFSLDALGFQGSLQRSRARLFCCLFMVSHRLQLGAASTCLDPSNASFLKQIGSLIIFKWTGFNTNKWHPQMKCWKQKSVF